LLVSMKPVHVQAGDRLMTQGEPGDCFFIIQNGTCSVSLEKEGIHHPVAILGPGDLVGEMAILTGENRSAHVDAQTDLDLWRMSRLAFETVCAQYPEIRQFLTQVVSKRFARAVFSTDRTIGKYVINEVLGRGGWSIVYKGVHTTLNMTVAVKMLKHDMAMDDDFLERFQNEARVIANLNHENIVKVYDIEHLFRTVFIVMEYLDGSSILEILQECHKFSPERALSIILQVCAGLEYAHDRGIVHGDIKPGNIFITADDRVKILDFGLACPLGTRSTRIIGTPKYFSPEAIKLGPVDQRSDIYSLGIMAYRMVTGQEAFLVTDIANLCQMHLTEPIPDPRKILPDLPKELVEFMFKATRKNPDERYPNVGSIIHELRPLGDRMGVTAAATENRQPTNMKGLFLFYRDEHGEIIKKLVDDFGKELQKIGAVLRETELKDV
jgi:eukaryotic-like serine/threonine-protein kinase